MKAEYTIGAIVSALVVVGLGYLFLSPQPVAPAQESVTASPTVAPSQENAATSSTSVASKAQTAQAATPKRGNYVEIVNPSGFVNTDHIALKDLVGKKVIVVDFLTYSCINCQRTFPYMNAWYKKYKDEGLEIVGIHTPEFAFEKDITNVREAMKRFGITYPIVLDNDYATWNAYGNNYWPRKYIIDIHGNVVYDHIGEGGYEETEMKIQELLAERAKVLSTDMPATGGLAATSITEVKIAAASPETYFGSLRNVYLANGTAKTSGDQTLVLPQTFAANALYLGGKWNILPEYAESTTDATVVYKYNAKDVYIVAAADTPVVVEVLLDGKPVGGVAGADVSANGTVTMQASRLYTLVHNTEPGEHTLQLKVKGAGLRFYAFTFG